MKAKNVILLVVAVGCGLAASYITSQLLANREKEVPTIKVLVAKKRVPSFTMIKDPETLFVEKEFPENVAPRKAITSFAEAKDKRTNKVINEEGILLLDDLADAKTEGLSAQMGPGERAVAIKVNAEKSVAGFVLPGSRVDVVATLNGESGKEAKLILQNMLVLAVDTQSEKDVDKRTILGQTVTLSAKPEEAQRLALAQQLGELQLVLRAFGDRESVHLKRLTAKDLDKPLEGGSSLDSKEEETAPARAAAPSPVPALPLVAAPEEKPEEKPVAPVPPPKKVETHVLLIQSGEHSQKAVFTREEGEKDWKNGQVGQRPDDIQDSQVVSPKPAPQAPKPEK